MHGIAKYFAAPIFAICMASAASAAPVNLSVNINVWHGNNPNPGDPNDSSQQALPSSTLNTQDYIGFFSYSGPIDFSDTNQATDLMSNFIPGAGLPAIQMSSPTFDLTSLFEFTFILPTGMTIESITHDDGISLYDITTSSGNLIPGHEGPTTASTTLLPPLIAGHNYEVWYAATNGAPSILTFNGAAAVPESSTWALLVIGFGALGAAARKRSASLAA